MKQCPGLFLFCRSGYEKDCAAEIQAIANRLAYTGYCKTTPESGYVTFFTTDFQTAKSLYSAIDFSQLLFARQWFLIFSYLDDLPEKDRLKPIMESIEQMTNFYSPLNQLVIQQANMEGKDNLQRFITSFSHPLRNALDQQNIITESQQHQENFLQLCFTSAKQVYIGYLPKGNHWPGGIPRLKIPETAPSRSYLKLEEAFVRFTSNNRSHYLQPQMTATDLGAAPGGWSWLLIQNHLKVTAVDNGPLNPKLLESGLCKHVMHDAFRYDPGYPNDWLICDIVDKPMRVMDLINHWLEHRWCQYTIFNLKLPMQQRYKFIEQEVYPWLESLQQDQLISRWKGKHLYHDRHEVTFMLE
ncbi:23S rRNA (cytidine(2498)-2'-O)-methyltransferase [hydrothermal vent metagenome]|uniref:23S rRNA (Cytidine(2498)-2'-O)-methyltransferase n=1 Tax=hydrothermal vent metagenome TaxID=652676 RepID=A0A3B0Z0F9_9ZZZZ